MLIQDLYKIYLQHPVICTDSRKIIQGAIFFALKGDRFDGNAYAKKALQEGAAYAVISDPQLKSDERFILVEDTLKTLQALASYHRHQFSIPIIAITGSNGKTTTKELLYAVLNSHYPTHATTGNLNNHIGVPLTLLNMPRRTQVAIIEMGMNHLGEIDELCRIAAPTHGIITNIGKAHMGNVGGIEGVKKAKSELYRYLQHKKGVLFVNKDEPYLSELAKLNRWKINYSQHNSHATHFLYQVEMITETPFVKARFSNDFEEKLLVESNLMGYYNFNNIMTAIVVGQYFKVPAQKIKTAIEQYVPENNRSQIIAIANNTFILDAYNANPTSMRSALDYFAQYEAPYKIAILGDMLELGAYSEQEHIEILQQAEQAKLNQLILVGNEFGKINQKHPHFLKVEELKT
ncbi:MAG: UDP-N-acetylmuramoyl-tripeptide--D-alanyl-D-alanine ligase [Saprospiraceae bacterium]|nr:UDP-N-acetylmuramoyl-tripeptide--D-alanyl-D-alanine ligase [Saprospiraceae bacterium]